MLPTKKLSYEDRLHIAKEYRETGHNELETPQKAFYRKAQDIILGNFLRLMENMGEYDTNEA